MALGDSLYIVHRSSMLLSLQSAKKSMTNCGLYWGHTDKVKCGRNALTATKGNATVVRTEVKAEVPFITLLMMPQ